MPKSIIYVLTMNLVTMNTCFFRMVICTFFTSYAFPIFLPASVLVSFTLTYAPKYFEKHLANYCVDCLTNHTTEYLYFF